MTTISIIIPVYNVEKHLTRCLDSVLNQSFEDWEAICVNDGSPDNSISILEAYAQKDARFKIISQQNQGLSMARNNGLKHVSGEYICFLDSDDFIDKNFLLDLYNGAKNTDADMVMTSTRYICDKKVSKDLFSNTSITSFNEKISILPHGGCWNKLYKSSFLSENNLNFPKGLYWEDNIFTVKACYFSKKLAIIDGENNSYNYISNPNGITKSLEKEEKRIKDSLIITQMIIDFVKSMSCSTKDIETVSNFCIQNFIHPRNLILNDFYHDLKQIIYDNGLLEKLRKKQMKKIIKYTVMNYIKNIFK